MAALATVLDTLTAEAESTFLFFVRGCSLIPFRSTLSSLADASVSTVSVRSAKEEGTSLTRRFLSAGALITEDKAFMILFDMESTDGVVVDGA